MLNKSLMLMLASAADTNRLSVQIAEVMWLMFMLAGIVKCFSIARRPTTNAKSTAGLGFVLIGLMFGAISGLVLPKVPVDARFTARFVACGIQAACAVVGFVLGVIGLAQITAKPQRYTQGIRQSVWAIGLSGAFVIVVSLILATGPSRLPRSTLGNSSIAQTPAKSPSPLPVAPVGTRLFNENIRFDNPPSPWVPKVGKRIAPLTCLEFQRANPEAYFIVICEKHGVEAQMSSDLLLNGNIENMKRESESLAVQAREPYMIDGVPGARAFMRAKRSSGRFSYVLWAGVKDGYSYRMITYGEERNETIIREEAGKLMAAFHLIDPTAIAHAQPSTPASPDPSHYLATRPPNAPALPQQQQAQGNVRRSKLFEYSITLPPGWQDWPDAANSAPSSDLAAVTGMDTCLITIPLALGDLDADAEVISSAIARHFGMNFANAANVKRAEAGVMQSCSFELDRTIDGTAFHYMIRTVKRGRAAIVAMAWTNNKLRERDLAPAVESLRVEGTGLPAMSQLQPRHKHAQALIFNEIGLHHADQQKPAQAAIWFERANQLAPDDFQILDNLIGMQIDASQLQQARLTVNRNLKLFPKNAPLRLRGAFIAAELGDVKSGCEIFADAFASNDHRDDNAFRYYMTLLAKQERYAEALAAVDKYRKLSDEQHIIVWQSVMCSRTGEHDRAINLLNTEYKRNPKNSEIALALVGRYVDAERYDDAIKVIGDVRQRDGASGQYETDACFYLGRAQTGLKHYAEAKTAFEAGLKRSPKDKDCADGLAYVSAQLGEGNNSAIKDPIDPVPLPMAIAKLPAPATPSKELLAKFDAYYPARAKAISYIADKEQRETEYRLVKVLNQRGVEMFSTIERRFDPISQAIFVNKLEVRDESGKLIGTGKASDCYIVDEPTKDGIVGNEKILHIPIPGLAPGCTIELITTTKQLSPQTEIQFSSELLANTLPVMRSTVYLSGNIDKVKHVERNGVVATNVDGGLMWTMESPDVFRYEQNQADLSTFLPHVVIGDPHATWEGEAKTYLEQLKVQLAPDASAIALANEITKGATTLRAKCDAVLRQVQNDYTYKGIEFGKRARIPQNAGEIIRHRYGDCKDQALLAHQLLAAAGLKPYLVLVRSYDALDHAVPSLDQFDHMIVCVERANDQFDYFDCTDKGSDLRCGVPSHLAGKDVLVLDPARPRIAKIPLYPADLSTISSTRAIQIDATGDVQASERLTCVGPWAGMLRSYVNSLAPNQRTQAVQSLLSSAGVELNVRELKFDHLEDAREPLVIDMKYSMRRRFAKVRQQLVGNVPATWERYCLLPDHVEQRETPYQQRSPYRFEGTSTVTLPAGLNLAEPPSAPIAHQDHLGDGKIDYAMNGRALNVRVTVRANPVQISAAAYSELVNGREKLISDLEPSLVLEPVQKP